DESIILTAHKVKFESAASDVMLTNQRLILIDAGYAQFMPKTIPLTTIETVIPGEDAYGNPIVTLSLAATTPGGATQSKNLVFSQKTSGERMQERNDWVKRLKEQIASVRKESLLAETPADEDTDIIFDDTIAGGTDFPPEALTPPEASPVPQEPVTVPPQKNTGGGEASPDNAPPGEPAPEEQVAAPAPESSSKIPLSSRFHTTSAAPGKPDFSTIAAVIIIILAVAGGVFIYSNTLHATPPEHPGPVTTLPITPAATTGATPVPTTITPEQTPPPPVTPLPTTRPPVIIPDNGVWVRVQYAGIFTGQVGISGGIRQVSGSGEQFYQIPTVDGVVEAMIQKQDGSGNVLTVEIYKNGTLVKGSTVAAPRGTIDIHVDLKTV
ncbi:MAG: hypothetical protein M0Q91_10435, partial [Methanoregula sp.]|nr:hypothetical protein [Methanoregula sp.]